MSSKRNTLRNDEKPNLPPNLVVGSCSISCLYLLDVGEIHISEAQLAIEKSKLFKEIARHKFDVNFFNPIFSMTPLSFVPTNEYKIRSIELPSGASEYYQKRINKIKILEGIDFIEKFFLYSNGILIYQVIVNINEEVTTDDIICITNIFAKLNPVVNLQPISSNEDIENKQIFQRIRKVQCLIEKACNSKPRIEEVDSYSIIFIQKLGQEIEKITELNNTLRASIYDIYENEFHALCVRTIEDWEKRYPKNIKFNELNSSLSPVGILRINFRNTLAYEFPYSQEIVSKLYYPAIIELRAWNLLLSIFLAEVQRYIDQVSDLPFNLMPISDIENKRKNILNALDDFNGYAMSTSRRTSNFYDVAINLFEIKDVTNLLLEKLSSLQIIVAQQFKNINTSKQNENSIIQNKLLNTIQEVLKSQQASSLPILLINILIGGQIAFAAAAAYYLNPTCVLLAYVCLIPFLILLIKFFEKSHFIERQFLEAEVIIEGTFDLQSINSLLLNFSKSFFLTLQEIHTREDDIFLQLKLKKFFNRITHLSVGIKTNRLLQLGNDDKGTIVSITFSSNYNYLKDIEAKEATSAFLLNFLNKLYIKQHRRNVDSYFFTNSDGKKQNFFPKESIKTISIKNLRLKIK